MADMRLASAGNDIKLWDCTSFTQVKEFNPHGLNKNVTHLAWSNDNTKLASIGNGSDKIVVLYPGGGNYTCDLAVGKNRGCLAFNSTSRYIVEGGNDGIVNVWDLKTQKLKKSYKDHKSAVTTVQFNWNDTDIASGSESGEIILYNVVSGQRSSPLVSPKIQQPVRQIKYSNFTKSLLGSVSDGGQVSLWDTNKRSLIHSFTNVHKAPATSLAFSPINEMLLMSVGLDKRIVCYDVQGKKDVTTMIAESPLTSIDLLHDGATFAVGSTRGKIYIYDLRHGATPVHSLTAHKSTVQSLAFTYRSQKRAEPGPLSGPASGSASRKVTIVNSGGSSSQQPGMHGVAELHAVGVTEPTGTVVTQSDLSSNNMKSVNQCGDVFSPVKINMSSPAMPQTIGTENTTGEVWTGGSTKLGQIANNSSEKFADGIFSPLSGENSGLSRSIEHGSLTPLAGSRIVAASLAHAIEPITPSICTSHDMNKVNSSNHESCTVVKACIHSPVSTREHVPVKQAQNRHSLPTPEGQINSAALPKASSLPTMPDSSGQIQPFQPPSDTLPPAGNMFQMEVLRNLVEEAVEDLGERMRQDILNLHMDMLKQFQLQQENMHALLLHYYTANQELISERDRLREENARLLKKY